MAATQLLISLDNFEKYEATHLLNSPRSVEACKKEGIDLKSLRYRPIGAFGAPGKPPTLQEAEFTQYEKKRQNMLRMLKIVRMNLIAEDEKRSFRRLHIRTASTKSFPLKPSAENEFPPQAQYYSRLLQKQIFDARKTQDRDNMMVFKQIEDTARILELQTEQERQRFKREMELVQKAVEEHKANTKKARKWAHAVNNKQLSDKHMLDEAKKAAFENMRKELEEQMRRKEIETLEEQRRATEQRMREEELMSKKYEHEVLVDVMQKTNEEKNMELDKKLQEKQLFTQLLKQDISREVKVRRLARELRHYLALNKNNISQNKKVQEALDRLQRIEEKLKIMQHEKRDSSRERNELVEAKASQVKEEEAKRLAKKVEKLKEKIVKQDKRVAETRMKQKVDAEMKRKRDEITYKIRQENLERQKKKDVYNKETIIKFRKQQDEKLDKFFQIKTTLQTQGNYIKMANELRKHYLKSELESSRAKCLTIDKLIDINEQFGSATETKFKATDTPHQIKKKMVRMLSDPFVNKQKSKVTQSMDE